MHNGEYAHLNLRDAARLPQRSPREGRQDCATAGRLMKAGVFPRKSSAPELRIPAWVPPPVARVAHLHYAIANEVKPQSVQNPTINNSFPTRRAWRSSYSRQTMLPPTTRRAYLST